MNFPLEVIFQMKYKNDKSLKAFKDFVDKFKALEGSNDNYIQIGFPDELTTKEFLDKLYADLSLTGEEGLYKIRQEMKVYSNLIHHDEYNPVHIESLSENARSIFKNCGKNQKDCSRNSSFFKVMDTFYPMFHPDRPYFINMVYTGKKIRVGLNFQSHYTKYLEKFGPEQNIPGFLMKNKQMILMIERQQRCSEEDPHSFLRGPSFYIFDCVSVYD